jgi:hypothetical protein
VVKTPHKTETAKPTRFQKSSSYRKRKAVRFKKSKEPTRGLNTVASHLQSPGKIEPRDNLHPAVFRLGLMFSEHRLVGSNARCVALLETFLQVIKDHQAPENDSFARYIQKHLDPHIAYILDIRPISLSLRECTRRFKKLIAALVESVLLNAHEKGVRFNVIVVDSRPLLKGKYK